MVCALGSSVDASVRALMEGRSGIGVLTRFPVAADAVFKVGESVLDRFCILARPRALILSRQAADEAMTASGPPAPDAVVVGITTGGMDWTEAAFMEGDLAPERFRYHGLNQVARDLADRYGCQGPVITVSAACASGAAAIAVATRMIQEGLAQRVLAGGVDSLCQLTYHGFRSLKLLDPDGPRPLDAERKGLSVAEGAGMVVLEGVSGEIDGVEIWGVGFSCDAHHPTKPHPEGEGALTAMANAIADAGLTVSDIDYINLHGTGTPDNDRAEARAIRKLFGDTLPPLSSIKGATGHSLAAAGALEAVVAARAIEQGVIPANIGLRTPDPDLGLRPVPKTLHRPIRTVLSNAFGFGGSNVALVLGKGPVHRKHRDPPPADALRILGWAAVTGAGGTEATLGRLMDGKGCLGRSSLDGLFAGVPAQAMRRLKRFSKLGLALCAGISFRPGVDVRPGAVIMGTGWGGMSETHDFLKALMDSDGRFASPTDFIGSVHNAAAGQAAQFFGAKGVNLAVSGGDASFEQALLTAQVVIGDTPTLVLAADEAHLPFSPLFDRSVSEGSELSDGGGALLVKRGGEALGPALRLLFFGKAVGVPSVMENLSMRLGGTSRIGARYSWILVGICAAERESAQAQLSRFLEITAYTGPVIDYRRLTGQFASASAVATVLAAGLVARGDGPVLVLGLGDYVTAMEIGFS